jgi:glycopeptide antibiotics resistance protein
MSGYTVKRCTEPYGPDAGACRTEVDAELILRISDGCWGAGVNVMRKRWIAALGLATYSAILIKLVVFKTGSLLETRHLRLRFTDHSTGRANYMPFRTIWPYLQGHPRWLIAIVNLVGNIAPFMPIGFLAPLVYRKMTWQRSLVLAFATGLAMEGLEVMFRVGIFDIDDVLLNAFGVMLGYWIFTGFEEPTRPRLRSA